MLGGPAFVCRLLPVYKLNADFLHGVLTAVIASVHRHSGKVLCLMSDNHPINRSCYEKFAKETSTDKWMGVNPVDQDTLYLLTDPIHLMKSVRNNWISEKLYLLKMTIDGERQIFISKT